MSRFLGSLAGKAQAAIEQRLHQGQGQGQEQHQNPYQSQSDNSARPASPGDHTTPQGGAASMLKQHGLGGLQNTFRTFQAQYIKTDAKQIQLVITAQKSVSLDFDSAGRDAKTYSKEMYLWGQEQADDMKDVSDRLAYLNFVQGTLSTDLAAKLDVARTPFKNARNFESTLQPRRTQRTNLETQLTRLRAEGGSNTARINELEGQIFNLTKEDEPQEREAEGHRRTALKESEVAKWAAIREYADKLIVLAQASEALLAELPATKGSPYNGNQRTATIRQTVQHTLDSYKPPTQSPNPFLPTSSYNKPATNPYVAPTIISPVHSTTSLDSRSFGETHQSELSRTPSVLDKQRLEQEHHNNQHPSSNLASSYPSPPSAYPTSATSNISSGNIGVNPATLNNTPTSIPGVTSTQVPVDHAGSGAILGSSPIVSSPLSGGVPPLNIAGKTHSTGTNISTGPAIVSPPATTGRRPSDAAAPPSGPTLAETGIPLTAGVSGPGPVSGSLSKNSSTTSGGEWGGRGEGGVGGFRDPGLGSPHPSPPGQGQLGSVGPAGGVGGFREDQQQPRHQSSGHETAEEEKKRLEREDRERFLRYSSGGSSNPPAASPAPAKYESAEEEKRRLEREARDRVLLQGGSGGHDGREDDNGDDDKGTPPPYAD